MTTRADSQPTDANVGRYRLLTKIGEGGMGVVHLAQASGGDRVALKVLRPHIVGDEEARERLAREVASLRRVTSPRVAEVIDADPWGEVPFVATRYVPGLSLHQHVREEGPISGPDLRWFAAGLAEAVIAVHAVGVLHRDIKPSNVLLEGRSPVLIDFGLARVAEDPRLTHTGWLIGTPGYLAPEVLYGEDATTATDVHAWAATVAFAAAGRPPFGTGPAMAIMDRVRRGEHDLSGVPDELRPLLRECLAAEPLDRPSTGEVVAALRPPSARPPTDEATMPLALAARPGFLDEDETGALGDDTPTVVTPGSRTGPSAPPTTPLTVPSPVPVSEPARTPYMQPPPPSRGPSEQPSVLPPDARRSASGLERLQRRTMVVALLGALAAGFAVAPYVALAVAAALALVLRTVSWTTEAARERQYLRGRRRWYDAPLTLVTTPWYLVVATGGTLLLLVWAGLVVGVVAAALALSGLPLTLGLLAVGGVLAVTVWFGPGARRLRAPVRRTCALAARDPWVGWTVLTGLALVAGALALLAVNGDVNWSPAPGAPWRAGTLLDRVAGWI